MSKAKRFYLGSLLSIGSLIGLSAPLALSSLNKTKTPISTYNLAPQLPQTPSFLSNVPDPKAPLSNPPKQITYSQSETGPTRFFIQNLYPTNTYFIKNNPPQDHFFIATNSPNLAPPPNKRLQLKTNPPAPLPNN